MQLTVKSQILTAAGAPEKTKHNEMGADVFSQMNSYMWEGENVPVWE